MTKTVDIIIALRIKVAPVTYLVMVAVRRGVVLSHNRNLVVANCGHLSFSNDWARRTIYKGTKDEKKMVRRLENTATMPIASVTFFRDKIRFLT